MTHITDSTPITATMPSVSSYLTSYGISPGMMRAATPSISTFSTTSYYLTNQGVLEQCSPTVPPCNFTYIHNGRAYNVDEYNSMIQNETVARAQPLLFSNSGDMVASFRALANRTSGIADAATFLAARAAQYSYDSIQIDLEPSCWAQNASACQWPVLQDRLRFVRFLNATADALHDAAGASLAVAVGNDPESQCTAPQATKCKAAGDDYAVACERDEWSVDECNCCAYYIGWFDLDLLCSHSRVARIVNMDTYQAAPWNRSAFLGAVRWYTSHGCDSRRTSIGLLVDEAETAASAADIVAAIESLPSSLGVVAPTRLDFWANMWQQPAGLPVWASPLRRFQSPPRPLLPRWVWYAGVGGAVTVGAACLAGLATHLARKRCYAARGTAARRLSGPLLDAHAENDE